MSSLEVSNSRGRLWSSCGQVC